MATVASQVPIATPEASLRLRAHLASLLVASSTATVASFPLGTLKLLTQSSFLPQFSHPSAYYSFGSATSTLIAHLRLNAALAAHGGVRASPALWAGIPANLDPVLLQFILDPSSSAAAPAQPSARQTARGVVGLLYRGLSTELVAAFPAVLSKLAVFQLLWQRSNTRVDFKKRTTFACFVHGACGGLAETVFAHTSHLIRVQRLMQPASVQLAEWEAQMKQVPTPKPPFQRSPAAPPVRVQFRPPTVVPYEAGVVACIRNVVRNEGMSALVAKGLPVSFLTNAVHSGLFFVFFKKTHEHLQSATDFRGSVADWTGIAALSAAMASLPFYWLDTYKLWLQAQCTLRFDRQTQRTPRELLGYMFNFWTWRGTFSTSLGRSAKVMQSASFAGVFVFVYSSVLAAFDRL